MKVTDERCIERTVSKGVFPVFGFEVFRHHPDTMD
jgi:hypothetical protein